MATQRASRRADGPHQPHIAPEHQFPITRQPRASAPGPARLGDPAWPRRLRPISHLSGRGGGWWTAAAGVWHRRSRQESRRSSCHTRKSTTSSSLTDGGFCRAWRRGWLSAATQTVGSPLSQPALPACAAAAQQGLRELNGEAGTPSTTACSAQASAECREQRGTGALRKASRWGGSSAATSRFQGRPQGPVAIFGAQKSQVMFTPFCPNCPFSGTDPHDGRGGRDGGFPRGGRAWTRGLSRDAFRAASM